MASIEEQFDFDSWAKALRAQLLNEQQLAVLQRMVDDKEATDLEAAAKRLDWQMSVIDPTEHLYGH